MLRSVTIFLLVVFVIFLMPNTVFAWFEYVTSLVKIFLFLIIIFASLALVCGAGPRGYVRDGSTWTDLPQFKNGFSVRACPHDKSLESNPNTIGFRYLCFVGNLGRWGSGLHRDHGWRSSISSVLLKSCNQARPFPSRHHIYAQRDLYHHITPFRQPSSTRRVRRSGITVRHLLGRGRCQRPPGHTQCRYDNWLSRYFCRVSVSFFPGFPNNGTSEVDPAILRQGGLSRPSTCCSGRYLFSCHSAHLYQSEL